LKKEVKAMKTFVKLGFGILVVGLVSCQLVDYEETALKADADVPLVGTEWDLVSFEEVDEGESDVGSVGILLIFEEGGQVKGGSYQKAGGPKAANQYRGTYATADSLSIQIQWTTEINEPVGSKYMSFIQALRTALAYEIEGDMLRIYYEDGEKALVFKARG
jgi:hypothetical protein